MEYFYSFQSWLYETRLYQEILKELPVPLNNIYFDSIVIIILIVYLIYRILEAIYIACYRRHLRRIQEKERRRQLEKEKEMLYREMQVHQKEQKFDRFMDYMELLYANQTADNGRKTAYQQKPLHRGPTRDERRLQQRGFSFK